MLPCSGQEQEQGRDTLAGPQLPVLSLVVEQRGSRDPPPPTRTLRLMCANGLRVDPACIVPPAAAASPGT